MLCFWLYFLVVVRCDSFQLSSCSSCPGGPSFTSAGEVVVASARATARTGAQTALGAEAISALCIAMLRKTAGNNGHDILESLEHDETNYWSCHVYWDMHGDMEVYKYRRSDGKSMLNFLTLFHFRLRNPQYMGDSGASQRCWALNASLIWPNSPRKLVCSGLCQHRVGGRFDGNQTGGSSFTGNGGSLCSIASSIFWWWKWQALARMKHSEQPFLQAATWLQYAATWPTELRRLSAQVS